MAKREFQEYRATVTDQNGEDSESVVSAHVVNEDTAGEVLTRTGNQNVQKGSVLLATDRPDIYDVLTVEQWENSGYASGDTDSEDDFTIGADDEEAS